MGDELARELEVLEGILSDPSAEPIKLSYGLLKFITQNFTNEIGRGGFAVVYKGDLQHGVVAVKKISNLHNVSNKQFMDEIKCLKAANHKNIVRFIGYCAETQEEMLPLDGTFIMAGEPNRLLCFEYVSNGNIRQYLEQEKHDGNDQWHICYKMIKGVCKGLQYLHEQRISHLDLKPENVMLDDWMEPKITDFGVSRYIDEGKSIMFTGNIRGTFGYIAPEMITKGHISFKTDIYALGFIIIRLLTGRNIIDFDNWHESMDLDRPGVASCIEIARNCIEADQDQRPTIGNIIRELDEIELTNDISGSSIDKISRTLIDGTEQLDVYPRKLSFPFNKNKQQQEMLSQVSIINKTDGEVGFFVLPPNLGDKIMIRSLNGILTPMSSTVLTLAMLMSKQDNEPPFEMKGVSILMFTMNSSDNVKEMMETSVDKGGELNMSIDELEKQVQALGGKIHRATLRVVVITVVSEHATTAPTFVATDSSYGPASKRINSVEVHPTKPWILVSTHSRAYIWDWRINETRTLQMYREGIRLTKFIARKHWLLVVSHDGPRPETIHVYTCRALNQVYKVVEFNIYGHYGIEVHPTRSFVLLYNQSMKTLDWEQNWSCTQRFGIVNSKVTQVLFNNNDANIFATLHDDKSVKIWKINCPESITSLQGSEWIYSPEKVLTYTGPGDTVIIRSHGSPQERELGCSEPIATLEGREGISRLDNVFTYSPNQHFVAAISGPTAEIWDLQKAKRVHTLYTIHHGPRPDDKISAVTCHRARPVLVTASHHGYIHVWDSSTYRLKKEYVTLGGTPKHIAFVGPRRLMITYECRIEMMDIDL